MKEEEEEEQDEEEEGKKDTLKNERWLMTEDLYLAFRTESKFPPFLYANVRMATKR